MAAHATPFGLFAGVALCQAGERTDLAVEALERQRPAVRLDAATVARSVKRLENDWGFMSDVRLFTNPAATGRGSRIQAPRAAWFEAGQDETSLRRTRAVELAMDLCRHGCTTRNLVANLADEWPSRRDVVTALVQSLVTAEVLVTELRGALIAERPDQSLVDLLRRLPPSPVRDAELQHLGRAIALINEYSTKPIGEGGEILRDIRAIGKTPDDEVDVHVDLAFRLSSSTVGRDLLREAAAAASLLWELSPVTYSRHPLGEYAQRFFDRYGSEEVPLLELIDPVGGLGPIGFDHVPGHQRNPRELERDRYLLDLLQGVDEARTDRLTLGDIEVKTLQSLSAKESEAPPTAEIYVLVGARDPEALSRGDYQLVVGPRRTTTRAGASFGRFIWSIGDDISRAMAEFDRVDQSRDKSRVPVELFYLPRQPRTLNLMSSPRDHKWQIRDAPSSHSDWQLRWEDIVVGLQDDFLYLRSTVLDRPIEVHVCHLLSDIQASPLAQTALMISTHRSRPTFDFSWGAASLRSHLPRLEVGKCVLSAARWRIDRPVHEGPRRGHLSPDEIKSLREAYRWPRYLALRDNDLRLVFDLDDGESVADMGREYSSRTRLGQSFELEELLPTPDQFPVPGPDGRRALELVVPLVRQSARDRPEPIMWARADGASEDRTLMPGEDGWIYLTVDLDESAHDGFLLDISDRYLGRSVSEGAVASWFFVRYRDPAPQLRIRFRLENPGEHDGTPGWRLLSTLVQRARSWGCKRSSVETYVRELDRYGGPQTIRDCERLFALDSLFALELIRRRSISHTALQPQAGDNADLWYAILHTYELIRRMAWRPQESLETLRAIRQANEAAGKHTSKTTKDSIDVLVGEFRRHQLGEQSAISSAVSIIETCAEEALGDATDTWGRVERIIDGDERWVSPNLVRGSILHMHANRTIGLDRALEGMMVYGLTRAVDALMFTRDFDSQGRLP